jgi:hypothetical protein
MNIGIEVTLWTLIGSVVGCFVGLSLRAWFGPFRRP